MDTIIRNSSNNQDYVNGNQLTKGISNFLQKSVQGTLNRNKNKSKFSVSPQSLCLNLAVSTNLKLCQIVGDNQFELELQYPLLFGLLNIPDETSTQTQEVWVEYDFARHDKEKSFDSTKYFCFNSMPCFEITTTFRLMSSILRFCIRSFTWLDVTLTKKIKVT